MRKSLFNSLLFIFLFAFSCSDDSTVPSPTGDCRVAKIIYEGGGDRYEQNFKYNSEGLLIGFNLPYIGPTCEAVLEYDNQKRLIKFTKVCGNESKLEMKYSYQEHFILEGIFKDSYRDDSDSLLLYYNSENQIDSARKVDRGLVTLSKFLYENGDLISSVETDNPCCRINTLTEATYDNGFNPYNLLKKASNNFGMISIDFFSPTGATISSANNPLKYKRIWEIRASPDNPLTSIDQINIHEFSYEYYKNSQYPRIMRNSLNGDLSEGKRTFIYEACK